METIIREIEWSASRQAYQSHSHIRARGTGGDNCERASLHNISIMEQLRIGIGDTVTVYKANMIIPQVHENLTRSGMPGYRTIAPCAAVRLR